jgi:hypothetical protein
MVKKKIPETDIEKAQRVTRELREATQDANQARQYLVGAFMKAQELIIHGLSDAFIEKAAPLVEDAKDAFVKKINATAQKACEDLQRLLVDAVNAQIAQQGPNAPSATEVASAIRVLQAAKAFHANHKVAILLPGEKIK